MPRHIDAHPEFRLAVSTERGHTAIAAAGELDISHADELATALSQALALGPVRLDLAELTFMDSSGVRLLDSLMRDAERACQALAIATELQRPVRRVLELTGMLELLPFETAAPIGETQ